VTVRGVPTQGTGGPDGAPVYRLLDRQTLALARLDERERIAMDLHDGVMQSLYAIGLSLATRQRLLPSGEAAARGALGAAAAQVDEVIAQMRDCVSGLQPRERDGPGVSAGLERIARELGSTELLQTEVRLEADVDDLVDSEAAAHILYVAREAVSNAIRHADPRTVTIRVRRASGGFVLTVRDDGRGFDPKKVAGRRRGRTGHGLPNMLARAAHIGSTLTVRSGPEQGTEVRLDVIIGGRQARADRAA